MSKYVTYALVPLMALLLVSAQAFWGSAVKTGRPFAKPFLDSLIGLAANPKVWAGIILYITATGVYFLLLSRNKFFSVQLGMAGISIVLSTLLSAVLFHEKLSPINLFGMVLVLGGVTLVFN